MPVQMMEGKDAGSRLSASASLFRGRRHIARRPFFAMLEEKGDLDMPLIALIGTSGSGKSSVLRELADDAYQAEMDNMLGTTKAPPAAEVLDWLGALHSH